MGSYSAFLLISGVIIFLGLFVFLGALAKHKNLSLRLLAVIIVFISPSVAQSEYAARNPVSVITIRGVEYCTSLTSLDLSHRNLRDEDIAPLRYMTSKENSILSGFILSEGTFGTTSADATTAT